MTSARVEALLAQLSPEERCLLTAGQDMWSTRAVHRVGIPSVRLTDGPNGARGPVLAGEGTHTSTCVPCGTALAATWDLALIQDVGALVGEESLTKGCRVLLAPTVNLHRSPLAGRNFECYSEDPLLSGRAAAAFTRGAQGVGVVCTVKHFVGNEAEHQRGTMSSDMDERTLRELYLRPFEIAVEEGGVLGVMTGYNRLNGTWCTELDLLRDVVRGEWGFEGFVVSDWGGIGSTTGSLHAGLDLEMPGPGRYFGRHLHEAVERGDVAQADVDDAVRRLLTSLERVGALDEDPPAPRSVERAEHRELARRSAAASFVLLRNDGLLPLSVSDLPSVAVIGPLAEQATYTGGGASNFKPHRRPSPLAALTARLGAAKVRFEPGCESGGAVPVLPVPLEVALFEGDAPEPVDTISFPDGQVVFPGGVPGVDPASYRLHATGSFRTSERGRYDVSLIQLSRAVVRIDGRVVVDGVANTPEPGRFPWAPRPLAGSVDLAAGEHTIVVEAVPPTASTFPFAGFTLGMRRSVAPDALDRAARAAAEADVAFVIVGSDSSWETEAVDRPHMRLRGEQDELVERVIAANPRTVVVVNTGSPVEMPWADRAPALLQTWFGGQEMADALVDVLLGDAEPGGRLPVTMPVRLEDNPSFGTFPGESGSHRYAEGVFVGYRWYDARQVPVLFPFGHGLSYSEFSWGAAALSSEDVVAADDLLVTVTVSIENTGTRRGSEVVQCYVAPPPGTVPRPPRELRAFAKVHLEPGESTTVTLQLDHRAFARWRPAAVHAVGQQQRDLVGDAAELGPATGSWFVDTGTYEVALGTSSAELPHRMTIDLMAPDDSVGESGGDNVRMHLT